MITKILWVYFNGNTTIETSKFDTFEDAVAYIRKVLLSSSVRFKSGQVVQFGESKLRGIK